MLPETATIDGLGARIVRCVQLSPRVPFSTVAQVLGVSEQTVARRYRQLERAGVIRVTALLRPSAVGQHNWMVRLQVRPSGAAALARALAQRDDVSWVTLASGGSEVVCVLRARTSEARDDLLMQKLPRTSPVLGMSAAMVIHRFLGVGHTIRDWGRVIADLDDDAEAAVAATSVVTPQEDLRFELAPEDHALIDTLNRNGRASYAQLASVAGITASRAARRVDALVAGGAIYFDVDLSTSAFGMHSLASLWLRVTPSELDAAGWALAAEEEIAFAGAVTGTSNLVASVVCRDTEHLYAFVTDKVGRIPGVQTMEITPVLRHVKQAGAFMDGDRLAAT